MPTLVKMFLEQLHCSKELLKDGKEVTYAEVQGSSSPVGHPKGSPCRLSHSHVHKGWLLSTYGSRLTSLSHNGTGLTAWPQTDQVKVFLLNLPPVDQ